MPAPDQDRPDVLAESGHPLFSGRRLKLGTFASNVDGGTIKSTIEGRAEATWESTRAIAQVTDAMEFEALVPLGRWRGFGGLTDHSGPNFESYSWAAGIGASTSNSAVFATSHVPTIHPILAAKQGATIDHITGGRFALNVVCGWDKQMEMFGPSLLPHDERYAEATEWLDIIKRLWTEEELFDVRGKYYTINEGYLQPKPITKPYPPIMNAGSSETGRHFAARYCDMAFLAPQPLEVLKKQVADFRALAWKEYGRRIQLWTWAYVVQGDTEQDARDLYHHYVHERGDWEAAAGQIRARGVSSPPMPAEQFRAIQEQLVAGGGIPLIGSAAQIVDGLNMVVESGLDGVLLSWPRYLEGAQRFNDETLPLLCQAGLR
jgi:FMNH2-dependent dimethyl sulfone monooxygenase